MWSDSKIDEIWKGKIRENGELGWGRGRKEEKENGGAGSCASVFLFFKYHALHGLWIDTKNIRALVRVKLYVMYEGSPLHVTKLHNGDMIKTCQWHLCGK